MIGLWLSLLGCNTPVQPEPWEAKLDRCPLVEVGDVLEAPALERPCVEALFHDFGVLRDPGEYTDGSPATIDEYPTAALANALWMVWAAPLGERSDLRDSPFVHDAFVEWVGDGSRDVGPRVYDRAAEAIHTVELGPLTGAVGRYSGGVVTIDPDQDQGSFVELAGTFVHEARHGSGPSHVRCGELIESPEWPDDPIEADDSCDAHLDGSFGSEAAFFGLLSSNGGAWYAENLTWKAYRRVLDP